MKQYPTHARYVYLLLVEGCIGSGKTELAKNIERHSNKESTVVIFTENIPQDELDLFYKDTKAGALRLQLLTQGYRLEQLEVVKNILAQLSYSNNGPDVWIILDRTFIGDTIFARLNHDLGNLDEMDMKKWSEKAVMPHYRDSKKGIETLASLKSHIRSEGIKFSVHIVFLNDSIDNCLLRINESRKNEAEAGIPREYLKKLVDQHQVCITYVQESQQQFFDQDPEKNNFIFIHSMKPGVYMNIPAFKKSIDNLKALVSGVKSSELYKGDNNLKRSLDVLLMSSA
jgi:deoxyadenosine/deoxycytidine kinase